MQTRTLSASLLADRSAAFTLVVLFHLALGYAFYSGLATTFAQKIIQPFDLRPVREPRRPNVIPPAPPVQLHPIEVPIPEDPDFTPAADNDPQVVTTTPRGDATAGLPSTTSSPPITPIRMDPRHPLLVGAEHYPDSAVRLEQQGRCVVNLTVAADGRIIASSLKSSSGYEVLDAACLNAVRGQRMLPALQDGRPVQSQASIPIVWKLTPR